MLELRDYQLSACDSAESHANNGEQVVVVAPTGAGKTVMLAENARRSLEAGRKVIIGCHREEILGQIINSVRKHIGFQPQIISRDATTALGDITVAMIPTLTRRHKWIELLQGRDYLLDECHHHVAPGYQRLKEKLQPARMIGYTATPITPTGDGLGRAGFTRMVLGPEPKWLMDNGFLCNYEMYGAQAEMSVEGLTVRAGEYVQAEMEERILPVNGLVVRDWKKYNPDGHRTISVGVSVEHAEELATLYQNAGISAAAVSGSTPRTERKRIFSQFRAGEITVLCACAVVDEGLDVPEATCLQLVRAVRSLRLYRQLIGRVLRPLPPHPAGSSVERAGAPAATKRAIIIDHGGSWRQLPAPDARIDWSLDDRLRKPKKDLSCDREKEPGTDRIVPATRVVEGRDELFLIPRGTPQDIIREKAQRGFRKAVRLYEKGILPSSAMRSQLRMTKYLDESQLRLLKDICKLDDRWLETNLWLNSSFQGVSA